jgi:hypothetical protein
MRVKRPHQPLPVRDDDEENSGLSWLPKKSCYPIDTVPKPYYCETKIKMSERSFTTPLLGLVLVPLCPCTAANHQKSINAYQHDGLGVAKR